MGVYSFTISIFNKRYIDLYMCPYNLNFVIGLPRWWLWSILTFHNVIARSRANAVASLMWQ